MSKYHKSKRKPALYMMIGNAVPPVFTEALLKPIVEYENSK
jgi:site-specific DNA-cytosine methylase